jgi:DNA-binding NtrC family response regulator
MLVGATVGEVERELVLQTLARCNGNRTRAARVLGMSIRTLRNKIREYSADGIDVPAPS